MALTLAKLHLNTISRILDKKLGSEEAVEQWFVDFLVKINPKVGKTMGEKLDNFKADVGEEHYAVMTNNPDFMDILDKWASDRVEAGMNAAIDCILAELGEEEGFDMSRDEVWNAMVAINHM